MQSISHWRDAERLRGPPSLAGHFAISRLLQDLSAKGLGMDFSIIKATRVVTGKQEALQLFECINVMQLALADSRQSRTSDRHGVASSHAQRIRHARLKEAVRVKFKTLFDLLILGATFYRFPPCSLLTKVINKADRVSREVFNPYKYNACVCICGKRSERWRREQRWDASSSGPNSMCFK